jgi:hypothetical protein
MDFEKKYRKYKSKYLQLSQQLVQMGGSAQNAPAPTQDQIDFDNHMKEIMENTMREHAKNRKN